MKKLKLFAFALVAFLFAGLIKVNAIHIDELIPYPASNIKVEEQNDGSYLLTLTDDAVQDLIIQKGEVATLDLNGHTLINFTDACEAIKVEVDGVLTIIDSSNGNGVVTQKTTSTYSSVTNLGTLNITGGTFKTDLSFYVIRNEGELNISGGNFISNSKDTSLIGNIVWDNKSVVPTMNISNGTFTAVSNVIRNNEGTKLSIIGGEFTSQNAFAVDNLGVAEITGGNLTSVNNSAVRYIIDSTNKDNAALKITGATLTSKEGNNDLTIYDSALSKDVTEDYNATLDEEGNVILEEKQESITTTTNVATTTQKQEENPKTSDNVLVFLALGFTSLLGVIAAAKLIKKKMNA